MPISLILFDGKMPCFLRGFNVITYASIPEKPGAVVPHACGKHFAQRGFEFFLLPSIVHARP